MNKAAFVAICGSPNVGKSTLLNKIIGTKLAIVSPKVQTTRTTLNAIYNKDNTQLVFVDTPGIFTPKRSLEEAIVKTAWTGLQGIDLIILVVDAIKGICTDTENIIKQLTQYGINPILVINKKDLLTQEKLQRLLKEYQESYKFKKIIAISAKQEQEIDKLLSYLVSEAPENDWYFPEDQLTTSSMRLLASEITREKLFLNLSDELPYNLTVETESWQTQKDGSIKVNQAIFVARDTHKQIILGSKGAMIKKIGTLARKEIEELTGAKIHLFLFIKLRENWFTDPERYNYLGMQQPAKKMKSKR